MYSDFLIFDLIYLKDGYLHNHLNKFVLVDISSIRPHSRLPARLPGRLYSSEKPEIEQNLTN